MADFTKLKEAVGELDEGTVLEILRDVMKDGGSNAVEAMDACQKGMAIVGDNFEEGEYFVSDLIFAGELMSQAVDILSPALAGASGDSLGKLVLCTVEGDLHDIGKNIVKTMLQTGGFEVLDLGIDVKPEAIVEAVKSNGAKIVGLSGVLTIAIDAMKRTVAALNEAGLGDSVKVLIGGNPTNDNVCTIVGADAWAVNPQSSVNICRDWAKV